MKTKQILAGLIIGLVLFSCGGKGSKSKSSTDSVVQETNTSVQPVTVKKYQIKSAIVTFENDLMGIKQKSILYFDDYGTKEAKETYDRDVLKEVNLCDGKMRYTIMPAQKTAYSSGECYRGIAYKFDWDEVSRADKEKYKVKKLSNMNVAGKDCESFSLSEGDFPSVFAGWNNVCLYQETKSKYGTVVLKAVKIEENASIPAEKFQVPAGYTVKKGM